MKTQYTKTWDAAKQYWGSLCIKNAYIKTKQRSKNKQEKSVVFFLPLFSWSSNMCKMQLMFWLSTQQAFAKCRICSKHSSFKMFFLNCLVRDDCWAAEGLVPWVTSESVVYCSLFLSFFMCHYFLLLLFLSFFLLIEFLHSTIFLSA